MIGIKTYISHEKNHGYNGRQAYRDIKHGINTARTAQTCRQLTDELKAMINDTLYKYAQQDRFYDQRTQHGATEGSSISFSDKQR